MHEKKNYWGYLSKVWDFLSIKDKEKWELMWDAINGVTHSMAIKAEDFILSLNPETSNRNTFEYNLDICIDILKSERTNLDIYKDVSSSFSSIKVKLVTPHVENGEVVRRDSIVIGEREYAALIDMYKDRYVIINNSEVYSIYSMYDNDGELTIQIEGDLIKYDGEKVSISVTSGLEYRLNDNVDSIPGLSVTPGGNIVYTHGVHYVINDGVLEFTTNILKDGVDNMDILYCEEASTINSNTYTTYGAIAHIKNWVRYNYDNLVGNSSIAGVMLSLLNTSKLYDYNRALNIYYGMPVSPSKCKSDGLFEAYEYIAENVSSSGVKLKTNGSLTGFIGVGAKFKNLDKLVTVTSRTGDVLEFNGDVSAGDKLSLYLPNNIDVVNSSEFSITVSGDISIMVNHIVGIYADMYGKKLPEIVVYGEDGINGVFHIMRAELIGVGETKLYIYDGSVRGDDDRYLYNDYINPSIGNLIHNTKAIMMWPTKKELVLGEDSIYLDSTISTFLGAGDRVDKYDVVTRNVSTLNSNSFPGWSRLDDIRMYNNMDENSCILEVTNTTDGAFSGNFIPSEIYTQNDNSQSFTIDKRFIQSITYEKLTVSVDETKLIDSKGVEYVIGATNLKDYSKSMKIVIRLKDLTPDTGFNKFEKSIKSDKITSVREKLTAYYDAVNMTIISDRPSGQMLYFSNITIDDFIEVEMDNSNNKLLIKESNRYSNGLFGSRNIVHRVNRSGTDILNR